MRKSLLSLIIPLFAFCYGYSQVLFEANFDVQADREKWVNIDNDGDGFKWGAGPLGVDDDWAMTSPSIHPQLGTPLTPDDWWVTPIIDLTSLPEGEKITLSYYIGVLDEEELMSYKVYITETIHQDTAYVADFSKIIRSETVREWPNDYYLFRTLNLSAYSGKKVRIAFQHNGSIGSSYLLLDKVKIQKTGAGADLFLDQIYSPGRGYAYNLNKEIPAQVKIGNTGLSTAKGVKLSYTVNGAKTTESIPDLEAGETFTYEFENSIPGFTQIQDPTDIVFTITCDNDGNSANNSKSSSFYVFPPNPGIKWDFETVECFNLFTKTKYDDNTIYPDKVLRSLFPKNEAWNLIKGQSGEDNPFPEGWGIGFAASTSCFEPNGQADRWLITPRINLKTDDGNQFLLYWYGATYATNISGGIGLVIPESYEILVSEKGLEKEDFKLIGKVDHENGEMEYPIRHWLDVSEYAGKDVYFAFRNHSNPVGVISPTILVIDNITIYHQGTVGGMSVLETELTNPDTNVSVYPNPVVTELTVSCATDINSINIYNLFGQLVYSLKPGATNTHIINVSDLPAEMYLLKVETTDGQVTTKKFIKK